MHGGGTHGVLVQFDTDDATAAKAEFTAFGKDIAMQIAAANPGYLCEAEVPASVIEKEKEILLAQISNDPKLAGKPEPVKVKMVEGKIGKFYKENCLVDQAYVCLLYTSEKEKMELIVKAQAGDKEARQKMINGNLRLVLSVVQKFTGRGENLDDLFQVGCIGLIKAIDNFNPGLRCV